MKRWGAAGGLWLAISVLAAAHPSFVPTDPPMALIQGDPGRTTLSLAVAHLDHGLRPSSAADARFVEEQAARLGLPVMSERRDVRGEAAA
ncbi:MAG: hypothetical protein NTX69_04810, partial [Candidatus Bipolaricaulota bacterium]|nr:hypothetical protein [Candidatus Bipolaricaulota bacterium]